MTTVANTVQRKADDADAKDQAEIIPEIIEERRKDAEGVQYVTKYQRGKLLGKGGFAKCFLGTHVTSLRQYALKIVYKSTLAKSSAKHKLQTEIKIHRTLKHTYVVKFERFFEDDLNVYMVLELCSNNSMSNLLKRRKKLTDPEVRYYLLQLIGALQYLHQGLVIHRDLKLGNLFIDSQMRLKVGDFGLATRLSNASERKKTFCGTPNYIAPEVLEGSNGHSFEVDIWSTGVIMYTLLVGKPPFESENVPSTYKRILATDFSFPDYPNVCDEAQSLLRLILQNKPESRPLLTEITEHQFFTATGFFTPTLLPDSALRELPLFSKTEKRVHNSTEVVVSNENDPQVGNRNHDIISKQRTQSPDRKDIQLKLKVPGQISNGQNSVESVPKGSKEKEGITRPSSSVAYSLPGSEKTSSSVQDPCALPPQKRERTSAMSVQEKRSYPSKFEVFEDVKSVNSQKSSQDPYKLSQQTVKSTSLRNQTFRGTNPMISSALEKEKEKTSDKDKERERIENDTIVSKTKTNYLTSNNRHLLSKATYCLSKTRGISDVDRLQSTMENVQINTLLPNASDRVDIKTYTTNDRLVLKKSQTAWLQSDLVLISQKAPTPTKCTDPASNKQGSPNARATVRTGTVHGPSPDLSSQPMDCATPEQVNSDEYKALCTLEGMHNALNSKNLDDVTNNPQKATELQGVNRVLYDKPLPGLLAANVWVVRYVDYTSKYGLGFLLNTGSSGVYFNDSTKIVIAPDGITFQYSERKRKDKSVANSEHVVQTHSILKFPIELQKKVTLLRHFNNYLVGQLNDGIYAGDDGSAAGGSEAMEKMSTLEGASSGASAFIPFGVSSVTLSQPDAIAMGCTGLSSSPSRTAEGTWTENPEMPFLKKWVRTKHAILFRLSNRTVQVLFMDRSEVLLTSEARMVTYVSKLNVRSEHTLEEVLQTGRSDIAKRLKYAKDIMFRLISTNVK